MPPQMDCSTQRFPGVPQDCPCLLSILTWRRADVTLAILFGRTVFETGLAAGLVHPPDGGGSGIRTQGGYHPSTVFKTAPFDRSGNPPIAYVFGNSANSHA